MPDPELTVVIPARNEEDYVATAIHSVAAQTVDQGRLEVVVVVNGTADQTEPVARAAAPRSGPPLKMIVVPEPGVARAKNLGAKAARGSLLLFLDADSRMAPDLAGVILRRAAAGEEAASVRMVADGEDALDRGFFWLIEHGKRLFGIKANMLWCRRDRFMKIGGFDVRLNHAEDRDLLLRLSRRGVRVSHVTESWIATSPRRLHRFPLRLGIVTTLGRWALGQAGIGRHWPY